MDAANIALQSHVDVKQRSDLFLRAATRLQISLPYDNYAHDHKEIPCRM